MSAKQVNMWEFQDDITKSLHVEQHIKTEFDELNPRNINTNKGSATIKDISLELSKENINQIIITVVHKGKTYVSKNQLTKENIEYLCGIANVKSFKIDEIIGSKIKFTHINKNSLLITNKLPYYPFGIVFAILYFAAFTLTSYIFLLTINIYIILTCLVISGWLSYSDWKDVNRKQETIFEFEKSQ